MFLASLHAAEGLARPSSMMRDELRLALQEARLTNWDIKNLTSLLRSKVGEMALDQQSKRRAQVDTGICLPTDISRPEALKRLSAAAGQVIEEP
jgi:hypothetical protein